MMNTKINVGERCILKCENIGSKGDGICKKDNFIVILPGAKINETYNVEITKVFDKFAFGKIIDENQSEGSSNDYDSY